MRQTCYLELAAVNVDLFCLESRRMRGDVVDALKKCAEALQHGNSRLANAEMGRVLDLAEEETNPRTRRLIRYFAQALACRAYGLHPKYWKHRMGECYDFFYSVAWALADVIKGKRKVHVIELVKDMIIYKQWLSIFYMVNRGGLTHLSFADIDVSLLEMRDGEFVAVNCMLVFSKMLSEALALKKLLLRVRDVMRADIMIVAEHDANLNQSDFLLRFDESLKYYSSEVQELKKYEFDIEAYYRYLICNVVACEGSNRVERRQTWAQWKSLLFRYGFSIFNLSTDFDEERLSIEWESGIVVGRTETKKRPLFFISAWKTSTFPFKSSGSNEGEYLLPS
ncbi:hypothetical protein SLEP1_g44404 [Rubroshorea leprosula]|uniref:Uncharacterized protein n=1 Tax=Rubroshorea leprosula TaxID=152421 RepID=A0AAV5LG74_9ROSI|nr:hypothetical protein SLEP1_g44404 [Rubroshorea leprosula]